MTTPLDIANPNAVTCRETGARIGIMHGGGICVCPAGVCRMRDPDPRSLPVWTLPEVSPAPGKKQ